MRRILTTAILFVCTLSSLLISQRLNNSTKNYVLPDDNINCKYYTESNFNQSIKQPVKFISNNKEIRGGIVPHHLLAENLIASFFKSFSNRSYDVVVIIGPNHQRLGSFKVNTTKGNWNTPFGVLQSHTTVDELVKSGIAGNNTGLMEEEHSVSSLIPYVKYFQPKAEVVPIILHGNYDLNSSINLGRHLSKMLEGKNYLVIGSIDFSHYLPVERADKMDEITLKAVKDRDMKSLSTMGNDNLDSPPTINTFLTIMNQAGMNQFDLLGHDNSARISHQESNSTTSYFTMVFYK